MREYEDVFENADDAFERLKEAHKKLQWEYDNLYKSLIGDLEEAKKKKEYYAKKNPQEIKDLEMRIESVKQAKRRAYNG